MNPFSLLAIIYLIGRYLRSSGDPTCERAGRQMEQDVGDFLSGAWQLFEEGCLGCCLIFIAICILLLIVQALADFGRWLGL